MSATMEASKQVLKQEPQTPKQRLRINKIPSWIRQQTVLPKLPKMKEPAPPKPKPEVQLPPRKPEQKQPTAEVIKRPKWSFD